MWKASDLKHASIELNVYMSSVQKPDAGLAILAQKKYHANCVSRTYLAEMNEEKLCWEVLRRGGIHGGGQHGLLFRVTFHSQIPHCQLPIRR